MSITRKELAQKLGDAQFGLEIARMEYEGMLVRGDYTDAERTRAERRVKAARRKLHHAERLFNEHLK